MENTNRGRRHEAMRKTVLVAAAQLFLEKGYTAASLKQIAAAAEMNIGSLINLFRSKEDILCDLVRLVLDSQFSAAEKLLTGITDDPILFYAAETTLQLYMAESGEHIRDLYGAAYSMSKTSDIIQHTITEKLMVIFGAHLPHLTARDFYKLEIASGGIMRNFMMRPCVENLTMEEKVRSFLETTFLVYRVPQEKIEEAIAFVARFDYPAIARQTIDNMLTYLKENRDKL